MSVGGKRTVNGYLVMQAVSAFQKSMRRQLEEDALYWAAELERSGYGELLWKRVLIIASEDVGMGAPAGKISDVRALYENWRDFHESKAKGLVGNLFITHAILILIRECMRCREVDNAVVVHWLGPIEKKELPDYSIDKHSKLGRSMGRGEKHWIEEGSKIINHSGASMEDKYKERAGSILLALEKSRITGTEKG